MLSPETLERYRRMTPGERLALALKLAEESEPYLLYGSPEQVRRRFEQLRRENDERNRRMLAALARTQPGYFERCHTISNAQVTRCVLFDKTGIASAVEAVRECIEMLPHQSLPDAARGDEGGFDPPRKERGKRG